MMAAKVERADDWGVGEVARYLGVSADWVYENASAGTIPGAFKLAKKWRFKPERVKAWYAQQGQKG